MRELAAEASGDEYVWPLDFKHRADVFQRLGRHWETDWGAEAASIASNALEAVI